ncbi:DUF3289 family protein [Paramixta manurensis]|uniref:DUF3289 family protein n=1 Tax=Paramixta manurensis TaxID=2740817 RepID=A0A6M8UD21_9GAMM|nr:DUF3289 family protein [Erwiniaceae bacterium PD-1]
MPALQLPCVIFRSQKWMDDHGAVDMRYGDLTETQLRRHFLLEMVSSQVDPWTLTRLTPFQLPQSRFHGSRPPGSGAKITRQECARILFDEMRVKARLFSFWGPYRTVIDRMITHMQYNNGAPFRDGWLDLALREQIVNDKTKDSSLRTIKKTLAKEIDWERGYFPAFNFTQFEDGVKTSVLPKFISLWDSINGLGISVHDTWATHITLRSLHVENNRYRAVVHYKVQDHFGLDHHDMMKKQFHQFHFFRIWFILQRYEKLGHRPFFTNMEATIEIEGERV